MNNTFYAETGWYDIGKCDSCPNVGFRHRVQFSHESAGDFTMFYYDRCVKELINAKG